MIQLFFDLPHRTALGRSDFLVSASNAAALGWIERWPDWPGGALLLHGPPGCGKTHLAHIWRERSAAIIVSGRSLSAGEPPGLRDSAASGLAIDHAETAPEETLLHLFNSCRERGSSVLVIARAPPGPWQIGLADLASRLRGAMSVGIDPPDDALLGAVLLKHFADRQVVVAPEVIRYLLRRMERSFAVAASLAARLDCLALSKGSAVTIALARGLLGPPLVQLSSPGDFGVA